MFRALSVISGRIGEWLFWSVEPKSLAQPFVEKEKANYTRPSQTVQRMQYIPPGYKPPNLSKNL
jgi:hypothetical protein